MSGTIRFISDLHFGHTNMAIKRGFKDAFEHDSHIIEQWNKVVSKKDVTWILGDVTMEKTKDYPLLEVLNGYKRVVMGNHDKGNHAANLLLYVNTVHGMHKFKHKKHGNIWLTHCPVHPKEFDYRINYNIHGHIHDGYEIEDNRYINVCAEIIDYTPKTIEELIK